MLEYGVGKQPVQNLTVSKATLSADKKKVTLDISGMLVKNVVYFKLSNIASSANEALVGTEAWYTQNAFGPGIDPDVNPTDLRWRSHTISGPLFTAHTTTEGRWSISVFEPGSFSAEILALNGRVLEALQGQGHSEIVTQGTYSSGLFLARVRGARVAAASRILYDGRLPGEMTGYPLVADALIAAYLARLKYRHGDFANKDCITRSPPPSPCSLPTPILMALVPSIKGKGALIAWCAHMLR